jgi:hypothetical protein
MRRLLSARGAAATAVGVWAVLIAGGGYALAGGGAGTIHACVHRHGGTLYVAKRCASHDRKLSWDRAGPTGARGATGATGATGPQGPEATSVVYNATGSTSPPRTTIGMVGPWTVTGVCTQSGDATGAEVDFSGPGAQADGFAVYGATSSKAQSGTEPGPVFALGALTPSAGQQISSGEFVLTPAGGSPVQLVSTLAATGSSPPPGAPANTCHFSAVVTPASGPGSAATATAHAGRLTGPLLGEG